MSDEHETARERRNREHAEQLVANGAVDDFAADVAADFKAADRTIAALTAERDRLRAALEAATKALEAIDFGRVREDGYCMACEEMDSENPCNHRFARDAAVAALKAQT